MDKLIARQVLFMLHRKKTKAMAIIAARKKKISSPASVTATAVGVDARHRLVSRSPADDGLPDIFSLIGKAENIEQAASAMQAMSHPLRIKILCMLSSGEMMVQELVDAVGTTQSNVSQHLRILKIGGIVGARKEATRTYYRIEDRRIVRMITLMRDIFCAT
jgi:ArsR family transcriptional regulator